MSKKYLTLEEIGYKVPKLNLRDYKIRKEMTKTEKAVIVFLILALGWLLGRFTEAVALGNLKF